MAKSKPEVKLVSYGIYSQWDAASKDLPKLQRFTVEVQAEIDVEFGMIVKIKKAKGQKIEYCIDHPQIPDDDGQPMAPFTGEVYVRSNDWDFFLGDTVWAPVETKRGNWNLSITLAGKVIAEKTFSLM